MKLSQALRLKLNNCSSNSLCDRESSGVDLAEGPTVSRHRLSLVLVGVVHERAVTDEWTVSAIDILVLDSTVQDVRVLRRDFAKDGWVNTKVLREDVLWSVLNPVVDHERGSVQSGHQYAMVNDQG